MLAAYPEAKILGVSATPERLDGKALAAQFDDLICGPSITEPIEAGYLAEAGGASPREDGPPCRVRARQRLDSAGVGGQSSATGTAG